jgi:hypothetical protein
MSLEVGAMSHGCTRFDGSTEDRAGESFMGSDIVGSALAVECAGESSSYLASDLLIYDFCSSFEFASLFSSISAGFYPRASSIYTRLVGGITTCI